MQRLSPFWILGQINDKWVEADRNVTDAQWKNTRLLALGLLLVGPHLPRLGAVAGLPTSMLNTRYRFPANFLIGAPDPMIIGLGLLTVLCVGMAAGGVRPRFFGVAAALLLVVGNSILFSVEGKIIHHQWVAYVVLVMSLTLWSGKDHIFGPWSPRLVLSWLLGWGLFTSAVVKVWGGWLDPSYSAVRAQVDSQTVAQARFASLGHALRDVIGDSALWELFDYGTVAFEVCLLILVLRPSWFRAGILVLLGFHVGILLTLGISFVGVLPAYIPFLAEVMSKRSVSKRATAVVAAGLTSLALFAVARSTPDVSVWVLSQISVPSRAVALVSLLLCPLLVLRHWVLQFAGRRAVAPLTAATDSQPLIAAAAAAPTPERSKWQRSRKKDSLLVIHAYKSTDMSIVRYTP